jgi:hypothetical protein
MNREEAKELLPVIQAFADGENVEYYNKADDKWYKMDTPSFSSAFKWRIKPNEPEYRPFKDADECWNEMLKHEPFGWVKGPFGEYAVIDFIDANGTARHGKATWDFKKSFDDVVFADGCIFGIKKGGKE